MYRQITVPELDKTGTRPWPSSRLRSRMSESAFQDFLAHYSHGRGFVLIGHSQGSFILRELIAKDIDPDPAAAQAAACRRSSWAATCS